MDCWASYVFPCQRKLQKKTKKKRNNEQISTIYEIAANINGINEKFVSKRMR